MRKRSTTVIDEVYYIEPVVPEHWISKTQEGSDLKRVLVIMLVLLLAISPLATAEYTDSRTVKRVQQALNDNGYDCGAPDGVSGRKTKQAIMDYQQANNLEATGLIDDLLLDALGFNQPRDAQTEFDSRLPSLDRQG